LNFARCIISLHVSWSKVATLLATQDQAFFDGTFGVDLQLESHRAFDFLSHFFQRIIIIG
jgi:hypothetical protein